MVRVGFMNGDDDAEDVVGLPLALVMPKDLGLDAASPVGGEVDRDAFSFVGGGGDFAFGGGVLSSATAAHIAATAVTFPPLPPLADRISYLTSGSSSPAFFAKIGERTLFHGFVGEAFSFVCDEFF